MCKGVVSSGKTVCSSTTFQDPILQRTDDKVIAVPVNEVDPNSESIRDIKDIPTFEKTF